MLIVDRIEGNIAVCENDGKMLEVPLEQIDMAVREGDMLLPVEGGRYRVDSAATQQRRTGMSARFDKLRKKKF